MSYTYDSLVEHLGGQESKVIKRSWMPTWAERINDETIAIRLNETLIMFYESNGNILLTTGGWKTVTTKARMNAYLPRPWGVYQENHIWYVRNYTTEETVPFVDGMVLHTATGEVSNTDDFDVAEIKARNRRIKQYAKGFVKALLNNEVSFGGDCLYCAGTFGEEAKMRHDHIEFHIEESYYVAALLKNAVEFKRVSPVAEHCLALATSGEPVPNHYNWIFTQVEKSLVSYLTHYYDQRAHAESRQ